MKEIPSPAPRSVQLGRSRVTIPLALLCLALLTTACRRQQPIGERLHELRGETMGTTFTIKLFETTFSVQSEALEAAAAALEDVDSKMSHYRESSEVSRFNRWEEPGPFPVSNETLEVLRLALEISRETQGAFDVTVAPLVNAWGFGPPEVSLEAPSDEAIESLLAATGFEHLRVDEESSTVSKALPGLTLDLSAIAKGYGVDRAALALDAMGMRNYMVEVGGEVRTRGRNERGEAWRIGIETPEADTRGLQMVVSLSDRSMATSGDYRNFFELDGRRISHSIDPRSGYPVSHGLAAVTIIDESCARADALATALLVIGPAGLELAEKRGWSGYFLLRNDDGGFDEEMTSSFRHLLGKNGP